MLGNIKKLLILTGLLALLAALWAGLLRLGLSLPIIQSSLILAHGPLMVSGFLGTLISLERAVALKQRWAYMAPALTAIGSLFLIAGLPVFISGTFISLGSLGLVVVFLAIVRRYLAVYSLVMVAGAIAWLVGNVLWATGFPIYRMVFWWASFLILTIAGERLELGQIIRIPKEAQRLFIFLGILLLIGLVTLPYALNTGTRLVSLSYIGLSIWLLRYDISRRTIRQIGLPRFAATSLLTGYVWLGIGGMFGLLFGGSGSAFHYDALLHALFLGFVISMIFAHAPIILPSLLGYPIRFMPIFYGPLILLHASLLLRVTSDLVSNQPGRVWGGVLNEASLLLFLGLVGYSLLYSKTRVGKCPV